MSFSAALVLVVVLPRTSALSLGCLWTPGRASLQAQVAAVSCVGKGSVPSREGWVATSGGALQRLVPPLQHPSPLAAEPGTVIISACESLF